MFDNLPVEIILSVVDSLDSKDLLSLLCWKRWLAKLLTSEQVTRISDKSGNTILHLLVENGETELVEQLLLKDNFNPDLRNVNGQTPLFHAVINGHEEIVKLLLMNNSVNPHAEDFYGWIPLWWAAVYWHQEILEMLLTQGNAIANSERRVYGRTLLSWAAQRGHMGILKMLLSRDSINDLNWKDTTCELPQLYWTGGANGCKGTEKMLRRIDHNGPNLWESRHGRTPLIWAIKGGRKEVVQMLLAMDSIDLNLADNGGWTPLHWAVLYSGDKEMVEMLLAKSGTDLSWTPLIGAIQAGKIEIAKLLLSTKSIDPNRAHPEDGRTALFWAKKKKYEEIVQILLEKDGVDPLPVDSI
jgi:ankyrin repeat protein